MQPRRLLVLALLPALGACTAVHAISASSTPGEFYVVAQRSFLFFRGQDYVLRCQDLEVAEGKVVDCERLLVSRQAAELAPKRRERAAFVRGFPPPVPETRALDVPAASSADATLAVAYRDLDYESPSTGAQRAADRAGIQALLDRGMLPSEIIAHLLEARWELEADEPVFALVARVLDAPDRTPPAPDPQPDER